MSSSSEVPKVLVLDGGFSTQLACHVGDRVDGDPLWTARFLQTSPADIVLTHLDFLRAGSDAIMTDTYQASLAGFVKHLQITEEDAFKLISHAVDLAKQAKNTYLEELRNKNQIVRDITIVGSCGPYGACLCDYSEYSGSYPDTVTKASLKEWHRPRIQALVEAGVDLLAFETLPCQKEGEALVELLKQFPNTKAWLSFSCKDSKTLAHGDPFQTAVRTCWDLNPEQLVAVGANCCNPNIVEPLLKGINDNKNQSPIPFVVYPNSGEQFSPELGWWGKEKCETLDTFVSRFLDLGVRYIGGCCRTYAADITTIKKKVLDWIVTQKSSN